MSAKDLSPALQTAALSLRVDSVTAEVVSKLRAAGIRPILLKGPSIAVWLYADGTSRPYGDTDLLVALPAVEPASQVLLSAGFREQLGVSSRTWFRESDGSFVDLHNTLFGAEAEVGQVWRALSEKTENIAVAGVEVETLNEPARLAYVALHAAQHESDGFERPLTDLERALTGVAERQWKEAATLAARLGATPTFAAGLRLSARGRRLADQMELARERPLMLSLRQGGDRSMPATLERIANAPGVGPRLSLVARRVVPPPGYMRWRYPRLATRGRIGLVLAYPWRIVSTALRLPGAIGSWRRARRASTS